MENQLIFVMVYSFPFKNSFTCVKSGYKIAKLRKTGQNPGVPGTF